LKRLLAAIRELGFPAENLTPEDLLNDRKIVQLGRVPVQAHIMTEISGVSWESAWESRVPGKYGGVSLFFIGLEALVSNQRAAGRTKDLADVEALGRKRR